MESQKTKKIKENILRTKSSKNAEQLIFTCTCTLPLQASPLYISWLSQPASRFMLKQKSEQRSQERESKSEFPRPDSRTLDCFILRPSHVSLKGEPGRRQQREMTIFQVFWRF